MLKGSTQADFEIDGGVLTFKKSPNYESAGRTWRTTPMRNDNRRLTQDESRRPQHDTR